MGQCNVLAIKVGYLQIVCPISMDSLKSGHVLLARKMYLDDIHFLPFRRAPTKLIRRL